MLNIGISLIPQIPDSVLFQSWLHHFKPSIPDSYLTFALYVPLIVCIESFWYCVLNHRSEILYWTIWAPSGTSRYIDQTTRLNIHYVLILSQFRVYKHASHQGIGTQRLLPKWASELMRKLAFVDEAQFLICLPHTASQGWERFRHLRNSKTKIIRSPKCQFVWIVVNAGLSRALWARRHDTVYKPTIFLQIQSWFWTLFHIKCL